MTTEEIEEKEELKEDEFIAAEYSDYDDSLKLKKIMEKTGWSQERMAEILHVSQPQISNYLKGKSEMSIHVRNVLESLYTRIINIGLRLRGFTESGGKIVMRDMGGSIYAGGATDLSQKELDAYEKACLYADPLNGGNWAKAEEILRSAGFEILYE